MSIVAAALLVRLLVFLVDVVDLVAMSSVFPALRPVDTCRISDIGLISADSHVNEPRDLWSSNLPPSLRDQAMRGIEAGDDGGWNLVLDGQHLFRSDMGSEADRLAVLDPTKRFEVMRTDGVVAECILPTIGLYVWMLTDPDGGRASCRVYNDWIHDTLQRASERFCCAGLIPCWDPAAAVAEVEHVAGLGLRALMLPAIAEPMWNHRRWEPLWDAISSTGLPVVMHQGTGHEMVWYRGPGATVANLVATQSMAPRVATMLATSGLLARYPDLHVVFVEFNTGWLAWTMDTIDYYDEAFRRYDTFKPRARRRLARPVRRAQADRRPGARLLHRHRQRDRRRRAGSGDRRARHADRRGARPAGGS